MQLQNGHQHFLILVLLCDLLRILLDRDTQEMLKAQSHVNSMSLCLGSNLCTALTGCRSCRYIIMQEFLHWRKGAGSSSAQTCVMSYCSEA